MTLVERTYDVEPLIVATVRVRRDKQARRNPGRSAEVLLRWAERQWRRQQLFWYPVGGFDIHLGESGDDFIRNMARYRISRRAIERDEAFDRWIEQAPLDRELLTVTGQRIAILVAA